MSYTRQKVMTPVESGASYAVRRALTAESPAGLPAYVLDVLATVLAFLKGNRELLAERAADLLGGLFRFVPRPLRVRYVRLALDSLILFLERVTA